ncbi:MAG: acetylornithine deacetylase, partial [Alphaproteobacteria bacterium]
MAGRTYSPVEMIRRLVAFDTTSRNSNLDLIQFVADYLERHRIESALSFDEGRNKANLFATLGPDGDGGIVLSGHTDVVPVDGQDWHTDPFSVVEKEGRLYGRGTADMKSFIAAGLALVPEFLRRGLHTPVHLALTYDEEVGCIGVHGLIEQIREAGVRPRLAIIGEPTEMRVVNAHKGLRSFHTTVTGLEGHSSATHKGVSAIAIAAELIHHLTELAEEMKGRAAAASGFDPPYTTINVGTVSGGTAMNIIPKECGFVWEYRALPGDDADEVHTRFQRFADGLISRMRAIAPGANIVTEDGGAVPGLVPEDGSPAESLAIALTGGNRSYKVSFGTEAGIFQGAGIPAVVCGPGSVNQAHKPDEFIALSEVEAC